MTEMSVADFKARFSEALDRVKRGENVVIRYGRRKEPVAALVPFALVAPATSAERPLGLLKGKARCRFSGASS